MGALTRIAASTLDGTRWALLAATSGLVWLAGVAKDASERLRR